MEKNRRRYVFVEGGKERRGGRDRECSELEETGERKGRDSGKST